ncbi:peroxisome biogenesis factor 10-like [Daktulosphaira vitifoliae]|uniref:peroxisome biogenesis factor 10-like n=1 Tax=Daktulosphaira vitifoliae TaxID=58002 RepID=UPI0021AA588D|nr:peroxisome biogenesis factor 10-like [Daktulosphaira vitifoliae]
MVAAESDGNGVGVNCNGRQSAQAVMTSEPRLRRRWWLEQMTAAFVIGRSLACSLVIEEKSIARRHCFINKSNGQYFISHNGTGNETYVNCVQIPNNQNDYQVLNHGDVISFADGSGSYKYLYRFVLQTNTDKKLKRNNEVYGEEYESSKSQSYVDNIHKLTNNELTKKNLDYQNTLKIQQDQISKIEETINEKVYSVLESDFQCSICNELMVKACTINCSHTFCEICLNTWFKNSQVCPLCRTLVQTKALCLSLDNFITNICNLLGNAIKEHREKVQQEKLTVNVPRVEYTSQTARRGGRRRGTTQRRNTQPAQ